MNIFATHHTVLHLLLQDSGACMLHPTLYLGIQMYSSYASTTLDKDDSNLGLRVEEKYSTTTTSEQMSR